jgi:hypothetical protein
MNAVLDVAAGLVLMYLTLSLLCTTLNELISSALSFRPTALKRGIDQLIDDPNLKALFYNHGLIDGSRVAAAGGAVAPTPAPPAAVSDQHAQAAAADPQAPAPPPAAKPGWFARLFHPAPHPSYLASRDVAMALVGSLGDKTSAVPATADVKKTVTDMKDSNIRDVLLSCLAEAGDDMGKLRNNVAMWFDGAMDRLSGSYRRDMQRVSFVVGLFVAILFNADTFHVAVVLWQNPTLAGAMAGNGASFVASKPDLANLDLPDNPSCVKPPDGATDEARQAYKLCLIDAQALAFPLGWAGVPQWGFGMMWKTLGLLVTTFALMMGAPFWFDVLSKFVNLRGTGAKPAPVENAAT